MNLTVAELWRYPVKGLGGEPLESVEIAPDGIPGDRSLRVLDERGLVTGRRKQRMIGLPATLGGDGEARIAGHPWTSPQASAAIREVAGAAATLSRPLGGHEFDSHPILLLSDGSVSQLSYDRRRFRPNIYVSGADGPVEQDWIGRDVKVGGVRLRVDEPCERCVITTIDPDTIEVDLAVLERARSELDGIMGVYCSVLEAGRVARGDRVDIAVGM
ncbi:MAG TPA: MOSC domain-containing protein [Solirubrobacterales bacterium]|nr:MOSC domain-containing protein [Solirubrobacterales bacterium]